MLHSLERTVLRQSRGLFQPGDRVVVAVSGGPDSTALLSALRTVCPLHLIVAHLDHGLRGEASRRQERSAVEALAARFGLPFAGGEADVLGEAAARGSGSLEAAARSARYRFLGEVAQDHRAGQVALGHTASDQVETVLMRVLRGTGLRGLGGIPRRRRLSRAQPSVFVIRPLLGVTREEVVAYLRERELPWVEDETNAKDTFLRNRLRNEILPLLRRRANVRVDDALLRLARQAREAERSLGRAARALLAEAASGEGWRAETLRGADPAVRSRALSEIVTGYAPDRAETKHVRALERVLRGRLGAAALPGGVRLRVRGDWLAPDPEAGMPRPSPEIGLQVPGAALDAAAGLRFEARVVDPPADHRSDPQTLAFLDAERVRGKALAVRRRRAGDRFWPLGAPGHRSLKRFLIDQKVPREQRDLIPVVTLDDQPVWVVGHRIDEEFKVTPSTAEVLELRAFAVDGEEK